MGKYTPVDKRILNSFCRIFVIGLAAFLLGAGNLLAAEATRIVVLPFDIFTSTDKAFLQEAISSNLSSEFRKSRNVQLIEESAYAKTLAGQAVTEALGYTIGSDTGAAYVVLGSLSEFGESISADIRILDIRQKKGMPPLFVQGKRSSLDKLAAELKTTVLLKIAPELRIARVEISGNKKIGTSAIEQVLQSRQGGLFSEENVSTDIKAIYKMGYFNDVSADVTITPEGRVLVFNVQEKAMIAEVQIEGNKALSRSDIEAVMGVKPKQIINAEKVKADVQKIKELYDSKGYYNAEVKDRIETSGPKDMRVVYHITEGQRLYIEKIGFEGNKTYSDKELRNMLSTTERGIFSFFTDAGILKRDQLKQDVAKLNVFYLNNGFMNAQVGEPVISHDRKGIYVKIPITEGERYRVGKVEITGDELTVSRSDLLAKMKITKKEHFDREAIMKDIDYLTQACNDEGYAYADVSPRTIPQEKNQSVDIVFDITKGKHVYFNRIEITGNTKTRDKVIRRELAIKEGALYNSTNLKKSYANLNRLRYFEEIDFQTEKGPDETKTDVNIRVKEKQTGLLSVGAGYSAQEHAMLTAQISQQNLFGRGQILSLKANIGSETTLYEVSFIEPYLMDMPLWSKFDLWNMEREYDSYDLDTKGAGFTLGYPIWPKYHVTGYFSYRFSLDDVTDVDDDASKYVKDQEGENTTSSVTLSLTRDTTDDNIFPSKGSKNSASVEFTGGPLGGDTGFTKYTATSTWFFPLPLETVLGTRGRIGYIASRSGEKLPIYERFYLGGINSLRGLRDVGPKDDEGDVIGGTTMFNVNVDFVFPLIKNAGMKGVIFYDTGNAWDGGYHLGDMRHTAGLGIRWYSPIGPLRLEWGYVLDREEDEPASRWEFTIGMFM
ncbi:MAG: Outer membrane protein assembly factor BamA precursor [Syntrophus sp. PtaU1.Bin208]|nr:MAG: Outer membrane protein assembly factor BamA precursor [Syntrophus sp. PtaU1.Bin208]